MSSRVFRAVALASVWLLAANAAAQPARSPAPQAPLAPQALQAPSVVFDAQDAQQTREDLRQLLRQYPPSVGRVLALDPTLLTNEAYLASYPQLAAFLATQPAVVHNPAFFGNGSGDEGVDPRIEAIRVWRDMAQGVLIFSIFSIVAGSIAWLAKSLIDHRRWVQVSKVQTDAHNKLLDRFTGHDELLAYIQTPAGRRFLESAPVDIAPRSLGAPIGRVLWSAQVGMVLAFGGLGLNFVSGRVVEDVQPPLIVVGVLAISLGLGFVLSAVMAYALSRRLGLLETRTDANA